MERTLKNGKQYRFSEGIFGTIFTEAFYDGKWNRITRQFKDMDEVDVWCTQMDYDFEHPKFTAVNFTSCPPDDEYSDFTKYYGD